MEHRPAHSSSKPNSGDVSDAPLLPTPVRWGLLTGVVLIVAGGLWYWNAPGRDELSRHLQRSEKLLHGGDVAGAYAELQKAAPHAPPSARIPEMLADLAIRQKLLDDAAQWIDRIPDGDPSATAALQISAAVMALDEGQPGRAETWLTSALRNASRNERQLEAVRLLLVRLYFLTSRDPELREQVKSLDRRPENQIDGELLLNYCAGSRAATQGVDALEWLKQALRNEPENVVVRSALASLLLQTNQRAQARSVIREASAESADSWRLTLCRIQDDIDSGRYAEAANALNEIAPEADLDARTWISRGRVAAEQHELETAESSFLAASQLDPLLTEPVYRLARLARQSGSSTEGQNRFKRADLLDRLHRAATRSRSSLQERRLSLEESSALTSQLGMPRLALLLYRAATPLQSSEPSDKSWTPQRLTELEKAAESQKLLSNAHSPQLPTRPRLRIGSSTGTNASSSIPDPSGAGGSLPVFREVAVDAGLRFSTHFANADKHWLMETLGAGVAVLDYDGDGWPDFYFSQTSPLPVPAHPTSDSPTGGLFHNERGRSFTNVTAPSHSATFGFGQGCAVGDVDEDGWPDLLVCQYGAIHLYRNNGDGTFGNVTVASGLQDTEWSTSAAFGDFDRDGDLDLYVVHYVKAPWNSLQACDRGGQETPGRSNQCRPTDYQAAQDSIWENRGDGQFVERTVDAGIIAPDGKGLAIVVEDLDNDGWPDIYVANDTTPSFLFHNRGRPSDSGKSPFSFQEKGIASGVAVSGQGDAQSSMGLACADVDGDGYLDLFVTNFQEETNTFYRNLGELSFKDDTAKAKLLDLNPPKMGWGCQFLDAQSRGRPDLFYVNGHLLHTPQSPNFYANTGSRFTERHLTTPYFQSERLGRAVATVDYNRDQRPDLVVTHLKGNVALLQNESKRNASAAIELIGRKSNRDGEGARIIVSKGQERRVYRVSRGGGYFAANDKTVLIGFGTRESVDSWDVYWPNGEHQQGGKLVDGDRYRVIEGHSVSKVSEF